MNAAEFIQAVRDETGMHDTEYLSEGVLFELVNAALRTLGDVALVDTATVSDNKADWKRRRPMAIDYKSGDKRVRVYDWEFVPNFPGEPGLVIFNENVANEVRIWFVDRHPRLNDGVEVSETIAPELAVASAVERTLRYQNSRMAGSDPVLAQRWNDAKVALARAQAEFPTWTPRRVANLMRTTAG